ncbi:MAG: HIT family protein [Phycisphaerales bacterium]|nr:HIT family protein [Phycisphaerales bacterium]
MDADHCIFCRIAAGSVPSRRVFETPHAVAFLDVAPLADGHTLLIPKRHYVTIDDMTTEHFGEVLHDLPRLAMAILRTTGAEGYNLLQNNGRVAGQVVEHVHFHIIPRFANDGLGYRWNAKSYAEGRADDLQKRIESALAIG